MKRVSTVLRVWLIALSVVFLHFASQVRHVTDPQNRFEYMWPWRYAAALIADVLILATAFAALALALGWMVRRWPAAWLKRLLAAAFLVAVASGMLSLFPDFLNWEHRPVAEAAWLAVMGVVGYGLSRSLPRLVRWAQNACLILSPAAFILFAQILMWPTWWEPPRTAVSFRSGQPDQTPVFLFVFDEWSWQRSTSDGEFLPFFDRVRELCEQSIWFRHALSPYDYTRQSMPRLLYQTQAQFVQRAGQTYLCPGGEETPSSEMPSVFAMAHRHDYNTVMLGLYLPYHRILGDQVDWCRAHAFPMSSERLPQEMGYTMVRNLTYWTDPMSRHLASHWLHRLKGKRYAALNATMRDEMLTLLRTCPPNTFAVFHMPPPHDPFVLDEKGAFRGPPPRTEPTPVGYRRHLRYLDSYIGSIMDTLRAAGRFDRCLLILTSDHSWRQDTDPDVSTTPGWSCRVPLIIKLPAQQDGVPIDETFCTVGLMPLLEAVCAGERDVATLTTVVHDMVASQDRDMWPPDVRAKQQESESRAPDADGP